ncbi:MAG: hypothetical protein LBQ59_03240 [Candidatus Peribacteria bacterium]|nr:hypothetical protein [Candidatus Peribacteria bacterium]
MDSLREILEINIEKYPNNNDIIEYMKKHKTDVALKIFDSDEKIEYPQYILDAIN